MKKILLPESHIIFNYFPELEKQTISMYEFRNRTHSKLKTIYDESDKFILQKEIQSPEHVNWRYPIMTPYYIKDDVKDKHVLSIGSRFGEICEGLSRYAKKITSVEVDPNIYYTEQRLILENKRKFKCERSVLNKNVMDMINFDEIEVVYSYTGFEIDIKILNHLASHINKKIDIYFGVPQEEGKLKNYLKNIKDFSNKNKCTVDYVPILWDESQNYQLKYDSGLSHNPIQFPITLATPMTSKIDSIWDRTEMFDNQCGVFLLLKITINE
tara:strand:- start:1749 stop:2558 length:810 start_codon:yes stop_codon:yes gene_type:complete